MRRLIGTALILHGLAHAGLGSWITTTPRALAAALWWIAMTGFLAAGAGLIGVPRLDSRWRWPAIGASIASLALIARYPHPVLLIGVAIDGIVLIDSLPFAHESIGRRLGLMLHPPQRHLGKLGSAIAMVAIAYVSVLTLTRPARPHGDGEPTLGAVMRAPLGLLVFEPAHFLTRHGQLLGAREGAEKPWRRR